MYVLIKIKGHRTDDLLEQLLLRIENLRQFPTTTRNIEISDLRRINGESDRVAPLAAPLPYCRLHQHLLIWHHIFGLC